MHPPLDTEFYRKAYPDLRHLGDKSLKTHWKLHGKEEKRLPNADIFRDACPDFKVDPSLPQSLEEQKAAFWATSHVPSCSSHEIYNPSTARITEDVFETIVLPLLGSDTPALRYAQEVEVPKMLTCIPSYSELCGSETPETLPWEVLDQALIQEKTMRISLKSFARMHYAIIIPVFGKESCLYKTVSALIEQGLISRCIFVVSRFEDLKTISCVSPNPNYFFSANLPLGNKINNGLSLIHKLQNEGACPDLRYVMILGSDDILPNKYIPVALEKMENEELDCVGMARQIVMTKNKMLVREYSQKYYKKVLSRDTKLEVNMPYSLGSGRLYRISALLDISERSIFESPGIEGTLYDEDSRNASSDAVAVTGFNIDGKNIGWDLRPYDETINSGLDRNISCKLIKRGYRLGIVEGLSLLSYYDECNHITNVEHMERDSNVVVYPYSPA